MNTIADSTYRIKWYATTLQQVLRNALVAEKICQVDNSDVKTIHNPYGSQPTATVQAIAGTYSVSAYTTTIDDLSVTDEVVYAEHVFDWENLLANYDLFANRFDEISYSVAAALDKYVLNNLLEAGTGTYTTPVGGFTTASNINVIISNLASKVMGYAESYNGLYLVIENTDVPGFMQAQMTNGFSYADAALNNGFMTTYGGVEIYVVRSGTFDDQSASTVSGTTTWTNSGHRLFGVKNMSTYASPRGLTVEEKSVTGKFGKEIAVHALVGHKLWAQKAGLVVDITLA